MEETIWIPLLREVFSKEGFNGLLVLLLIFQIAAYHREAAKRQDKLNANLTDKIDEMTDAIVSLSNYRGHRRKPEPLPPGPKPEPATTEKEAGTVGSPNP